MKYGIICSMDEEFGMFGNEISDKKISTVFGRDFIEGKIGENDVVAVVSRIGKVAASITSTLLINKFNVDCIIFCGIAGSLDKNIGIGDIVIADKCLHHDLYLSLDDLFRIPILNIKDIPCDKALSEKCFNTAKKFCDTCNDIDEIREFNKTIGIKSPKVTYGAIVSGDQFINDNNKKNWIKEHIEDALCVEMEGAAVSQTCYEASIPCAVIRIISDCADENADVSFEKFLHASSLYSCNILKMLLK